MTTARPASVSTSRDVEIWISDVSDTEVANSLGTASVTKQSTSVRLYWYYILMGRNENKCADIAQTFPRAAASVHVGYDVVQSLYYV